MTRCEACECSGCSPQSLFGRDEASNICQCCGGFGWFGIDPTKPTDFSGSDKVPVLQVRYAAGEPLWHPDDNGVLKDFVREFEF